MATADNKNFILYPGSDTIQFNLMKDMLIYFNKIGEGMVLYPTPN
jgi:hypothetical protein